MSISFKMTVQVQVELGWGRGGGGVGEGTASSLLTMASMFSPRCPLAHGAPGQRWISVLCLFF